MEYLRKRTDGYIMELKYYLRGLGLGIVVTALIMGMISSRGHAMTDEEIIARAKQLGMTESRVLTDTAANDGETEEAADENGKPEENGGLPDEGTSADASSEGENASDSDPASVDSASNDPAGMTASGDEEAPVLPPDEEETGQDTEEQAGAEPAGDTGAEEQNEPVDMAGQDQTAASGAPTVITVGSGDGSYTVSKKLEDVGAIASASDFDTFLCENGYDKKIRSGNYTIPAGASDEQIARMITGMQSE